MLCDFKEFYNQTPLDITLKNAIVNVFLNLKDVVHSFPWVHMVRIVKLNNK